MIISDFKASPAEITIYDDTNGYLYLGYAIDGKIALSKKYKKSIEGFEIPYNSNYSLDATFLNFDYLIADSIESREGTKQTIYIVYENGGIETIAGVYFRFEYSEKLKNGEIREGSISASFNDKNLISSKVNLLMPTAVCDNDSNSDDLADGWVKNTDADAFIEPSFLSGRGNAQGLGLSGGSSCYAYMQANIPFMSYRVFTVSAAVKNDPHNTLGDANVCMGVYFRGVDNGYISQPYGVFQFASQEEKRISYTAQISPSKLVKSVEIIFHNKSGTEDYEILVDDVQIVLGKESNFKEF